jgi:ABC-2 type transport system ATP-binding protein
MTVSNEPVTQRDDVIQTRGLTAYFGANCAVRELTLSVPRGGVFAFLGRNGSGKTTTLRMLLGLLPPTRGSSTLLGQDSQKLSPATRGRVGYLSEGHPVYRWMRVEEAGAFQQSFHQGWNRELFDGIVDYFQLARKQRVGSLSRGQRAGLCLALTLAPQPELLVLDDPALGLDPVARRAFLEAMLYFTRDGERTILFSSHLLADVERVADRIAVIDRGVLRANCAVETFRERVRQVVIEHDEDALSLPEIPGLLALERSEGQTTLTIANFNGSTQRLLESVGAKRVVESPLGLEEAFTRYLDKRGARDSFLAAVGGKS